MDLYKIFSTTFSIMDLTFGELIIDFILTAVAYMAFPIIKFIINNGKFEKKRANKIAVWNSIVVKLIFFIISIIVYEGEGNFDFNIVPAILYYFINRWILTDKRKEKVVQPTKGTNNESYDHYEKPTHIFEKLEEQRTNYRKSIAGLKYKLSSDGTSYSVIGIGTVIDTDIVIPSTYNGLPVTNIGDDAFKDCLDIESITIPNSVTSIGYNAFYWCDSLTNIIIPNSVTKISGSAFNSCSRLKNVYYKGTQEQWNNIDINNSGNYYLKRATIHYNYVIEKIKTIEEHKTINTIEEQTITSPIENEINNINSLLERGIIKEEEYESLRKGIIEKYSNK